MSELAQEADEALDRRLRALPVEDVGGWRREHVRRRAHALLEERAEGQGQRPAGPRSLWDRVFEPALLAAVCLLTLGWAFSQTAALLIGP